MTKSAVDQIREDLAFHKHFFSPDDRIRLSVLAVRQLLAERDAAVLDAERYRWLRDRAVPGEKQIHCSMYKNKDQGLWFTEWVKDEALDELVDSDRKQNLQAAPVTQ